MCWNKNKNEGGLSLGGFLLRLILIIIFVLLLIWLCPMLGSKTYNNSTFNNNLDRMRIAATAYYTNERLPKEVGESNKITLKELVNNKLLLPILDGRGRTCNEEKSYVKIEKKATEYIMTIYLSCDDNSDFIEIPIGCYDKCDNFDLSKQVVEYQFKKTTQKTKKVAYCPRTYTLIDNKCQKTVVEEDSFDATRILSCDSGYVLTNGKCIATSESITNRVCPTGYNLTNGTCTKTTIVTTNFLVSYSCPSGYTRSGTKCTKDTTIFDGYTNLVSTYLSQECDSCAKITHYLYEASRISTRYCPSGYTNINGVCSKSLSETTESICPSGYTDKNGICTMSATTVRDPKETYSCPIDYMLENKECVKEIKTTLTTTVLYKTIKYNVTNYKWYGKAALEGWIFTGKTRAINKCECSC